MYNRQLHLTPLVEGIFEIHDVYDVYLRIQNDATCVREVLSKNKKQSRNCQKLDSPVF